MEKLKELYISKEELRENYNLDLENFAVEETAIDTLINICVGKVITEIYKLNDQIRNDEEIYNFLVENGKTKAFKKLQYSVIYNYLYISGDDPITYAIRDIITHELKLSRINGIQKGVYSK